jgi:hypothetical protein
MVVAMIALFASLSGTGYAVSKLPKNSVGSSQLRAGAVQTSDIKDGAVTPSKLASGVLPGQRSASAPDRVAYADRAGFAARAESSDRASFADAAERATTAASAERVDSAGTADDADLLDGRDSSDFLPRGLIVDVPRFTLTDNQQRNVLRLGPFTVTARCDLDATTANGGRVDSADMLVSSTQAHSVLEGFTLNPDLGPGSLERNRVLISVAPAVGQPGFESSADGTFVAPDGTQVRSAVVQAGVNVYGDDGKCTFGGFFLI